MCLQCLASTSVPGGVDIDDVHLALNCDCCGEGHHHGQEASACPGTHEGECWKGPQSGPKPDGCTVCRPLLILAEAEMTPAEIGA